MCGVTALTPGSSPAAVPAVGTALAAQHVHVATEQEVKVVPLHFQVGAHRLHSKLLLKTS